MSQEKSVRGCTPKHKFKVWDTTSTNEATLSHDMVGSMLSDECKWPEVFEESVQVFFTCITSVRRWTEWQNQLQVHLTWWISEWQACKFRKQTLTHLAYFALYIDITYFHVCFTYTSHNFCVHTHTKHLQVESP